MGRWRKRPTVISLTLYLEKTTWINKTQPRRLLAPQNAPAGFVQHWSFLHQEGNSSPVKPLKQTINSEPDLKTNKPSLDTRFQYCQDLESCCSNHTHCHSEGSCRFRKSPSTASDNSLWWKCTLKLSFHHRAPAISDSSLSTPSLQDRPNSAAEVQYCFTLAWNYIIQPTKCRWTPTGTLNHPLSSSRRKLI